MENRPKSEKGQTKCSRGQVTGVSEQENRGKMKDFKKLLDVQENISTQKDTP